MIENKSYIVNYPAIFAIMLTGSPGFDSLITIQLGTLSSVTAIVNSTQLIAQTKGLFNNSNCRLCELNRGLSWLYLKSFCSWEWMARRLSLSIHWQSSGDHTDIYGFLWLSLHWSEAIWMYFFTSCCACLLQVSDFSDENACTKHLKNSAARWTI